MRRRLASHVQMRRMMWIWGPWLEEGLCADPHGNGIHSNMQMSMQLFNQKSGICFLEKSGHEKSGCVCLWYLTSGSG